MGLSKTFRYLWVLPLIISCLYSLQQQGFSQQAYFGLPSAANCSKNSTTDSNGYGGYICDGAATTCHAYLTFRASPPYRTTIQSISRLLNADSSTVSDINKIPETTVLETNRLVLVPINCTCSGSISIGYYQVNVPYIAQTGDSASSIVNHIFQGLATCKALLNQNPTTFDAAGTGVEIIVPIRCGCPTVTQREAKIRYLMTYMVAEGDAVVDVSARFRVDPQLTLKANELSEQSSSMIYPSTALLVPVTQKKTSISVSPPPSAPRWRFSLKRWMKIALGIAAGLIGLSLGTVFTVNCCNTYN